MNKLNQIIFAFSCLWELEKHEKKTAGFRELRERADSMLSALLFFLILAVGILAGWVKIPTWLGDGYSYDNF